ncbi:MAG: SAM-dependent methyltransferase [Actinomycetales bacterium]
MNGRGDGEGRDMEQAPPGIDPTVPSVARIYDYVLGGKDNFAVDREAAEKLLRASPNAREEALANRRFIGRAVRFLVGNGIRQFLDIGAGLPTQENVHEVALRAATESRIVYVDNDPIVLVHARALLADDRQTIAVEGDLREPEGILNNPEVTGHLDFSRPIGLMLVAILHFIPDDIVYRAVETLRGRLVPGSAIVISHFSTGELGEEEIGTFKKIATQTSAGVLVPRTREEIRRFFDGCDLVEPGLVPVDDWRPGEDEPRLPRLPGLEMCAGVGIRR